MPIYEITSSEIRKLGQTTFSAAGIRERVDLQRLLRSNVDVISPDTLVVAEEFGRWDDSRRRIDLLGLDREANIVVIELKRTEDGGHMELQAIRYAAMVSTMTFEKVVDVYADYLRRIGEETESTPTTCAGSARRPTPAPRSWSSSPGRRRTRTSSAGMSASSWPRRSSRRS